MSYVDMMSRLGQMIRDHEGEGYDLELLDSYALEKVARYLVQNGYQIEDIDDMADMAYCLYDFAKFGA